MQEVQVLEATRTAPNSRGRVRSNPITVERIRVAAYVRVSTDDDDQLGSFEYPDLPEIRWIPCSIPECLRIRILVLFLKKKTSAPWICRERCF